MTKCPYCNEITEVLDKDKEHGVEQCESCGKEFAYTCFTIREYETKQIEELI